MPRIIHSADIHLGSKYSGLGRAGSRMRNYQKASFKAIIDETIARNADVLIIAGDLFDSTLVSSSTFRFVAEQIALLGEKPVVVIPGTHDPSDANIIWNSLKRELKSSNFFLLSKPEQSPHTFPDLNITFWVKPNPSVNSAQSPIPELSNPSLSKFNMAIAHGSATINSVSGGMDFPFKEEEIARSGFDYVALGHWHSYKQIGMLNAYYPGSSENTKFGLEDAGNILAVDLNESGAQVEKIRVGLTKWHDISLSTEIVKSPGDILKELETYAGEANLVRCRIIGSQIPGTNFDTEQIETELEDHFLFIQIIDETSAEEILQTIPTFSPFTITGQFVKNIQERMVSATPEMKAVLEEALKLGCRLLTGDKLDR